MTTFALEDGMTLVVSVDNCDWQTVTFASKQFAEIHAATPAEVADQLNEAAETDTSAWKKHDDLDLINAELMAAAAQQRRTQKTPGGG